MGSTQVPALAAVLILALLGSGRDSAASGAGVGQFIREMALGNVVRVRKPSGKTGFGLIVGRRGDDLWLALPRHVLEEGVVGPPRQIEGDTLVLLKDREEISVRLSKPLRDGGARDLSFVSFNHPRNPMDPFSDKWMQAVLSSVRVGDRVWIAGAGGSLVYGSDVGTVVSVVDGDVTISGLTTDDGQSGAIIVSDSGIAAIHLGLDAGSNVRALSLDYVRKSAADQPVPFELVSSEARLEPARVCLANEGPEKVPVILQGSSRIALDPNGCADLTTQTYRVETTDPYVRCTPASVAVTEGMDELVVSCSPRLDGWWESQSFGGILISPRADGRWSWSGLDRSKVGQVSGELTQGSDDYFVRGETTTGEMVFGSATVERRELRLRLKYGDGAEEDFVLSR